MTIRGVLDAHKVKRFHPFTCKCGWSLGDRAPGGQSACHRAHVAEVLEQHMQEREAAAVRDAARYIERIFPKGLVDIRGVLADLKIAATRIGNGLHANGRDKEARDGR